MTTTDGVQLLPRARDQDPVKRATSLAVWSEGDTVDAQADEIRRIVGDACLPGEFDRLQQLRESRATVMEEAALQRRLKREGLKPLSRQRLFLINKWELSLQDVKYGQAREFLALHEPTLTSAQQDLLSWLDKADQLSLRAHGLHEKAQQMMSCGLYGVRFDGSVCGKPQAYRPYTCKLRYCPTPCGPAAHQRLLKKYLPLGGWADEFIRAHPGYRLCILDVTAVKPLAGMPSPDHVQRFNEDVKRLYRRIEQYCRAHYGRGSRCGYLYCDEFGYLNSNLHCHGVLLVPGFIPIEEISKWWSEIRQDGSYRVNIAIAKSFETGLRHALEYTGKYAASGPENAARLEAAFFGCRRVHGLGLFFNRLPDEDKDNPVSPPCPCARPGCVLVERNDLGWVPIGELRLRGLRPLEEFTGTGPPKVSELGRCNEKASG